MTDTTSELRQAIESIPVGKAPDGSPLYLEDVMPAEAVEYFDGIMQLIEQYGREQRIDALQRILGHWHHGSHPSPETVVKLAERDLAVLKTMKREPDEQ